MSAEFVPNVHSVSGSYDFYFETLLFHSRYRVVRSRYITLHHLRYSRAPRFIIIFVAVSIVKFAFRLVPSNHRQSEKPSCVFVNCIRRECLRELQVYEA